MDRVSIDSKYELEKNEIDHVKPISSFDESKDEEVRNVFNWVNTQPLVR